MLRNLTARSPITNHKKKPHTWQRTRNTVAGGQYVLSISESFLASRVPSVAVGLAGDFRRCPPTYLFRLGASTPGRPASSVQIASAPARIWISESLERSGMSAGIKMNPCLGTFRVLVFRGRFSGLGRRKAEVKSGSFQSQERWRPIIRFVLTPHTSSACARSVSMV